MIVELNKKKYKNDLLQVHRCKICGKVWNDYGEEVKDSYLKMKYSECDLTITVICDSCKTKIKFDILRNYKEKLQVWFNECDKNNIDDLDEFDLENLLSDFEIDINKF